MSFLFKPKARCFGRDIDKLVSLERKTFNRQYDEIPIHLMMAVEILQKQKLKKGIFRVSGSVKVIKIFKEICDSHKFDPELFKNELEREAIRTEGQHSLASFIKQYLLNLPDPIISYSDYPKFVSVSKIDDEKKRLQNLKQLVKNLSNPRRKTLKKMIKLFHIIQLKSEETSMDAKNLAIAVSGSCIRTKKIDTKSIQKNMDTLLLVQKCFVSLILNYEMIFDDQIEVEYYKVEIIPSSLTPTDLSDKKEEKLIEIVEKNEQKEKEREITLKRETYEEILEIKQDDKNLEEFTEDDEDSISSKVDLIETFLVDIVSTKRTPKKDFPLKIRMAISEKSMKEDVKCNINSMTENCLSNEDLKRKLSFHDEYDSTANDYEDSPYVGESLNEDSIEIVHKIEEKKEHEFIELEVKEDSELKKESNEMSNDESLDSENSENKPNTSFEEEMHELNVEHKILENSKSSVKEESETLSSLLEINLESKDVNNDLDEKKIDRRIKIDEECQLLDSMDLDPTLKAELVEKLNNINLETHIEDLELFTTRSFEEEMLNSPRFQDILCDACGEYECNIYCQICQEYQCKECAIQLHLPKKKKQHLDSFLSPLEHQNENQQMHCTIHNEKLKLICFTCDKLICFSCVIHGFGTHFNHETESIFEAQTEHFKENISKESFLLDQEDRLFRFLEEKVEKIMKNSEVKGKES
eukprot:gene9973-2292_t